MESGGHFFLLQIFLWLFLSSKCCGSLLDVQCLKKLQQSLIDPDSNLNSSWIFDNKTEGFICKFNGIDCWHPDENKVLNIRLTNMNLQGQFPSGLEDCQSLTGLDLSNNNFSGPMPANLSERIPFVTSLDLSFNSFSGNIPINLSNCTDINVLSLQHNRLTGSIPVQLIGLSRLTKLNVADNLLSGVIPPFNVSLADYSNNVGLCGKPLGACNAYATPSKRHTGVIIGSTIGGVAATVLVVGAVIFFLVRNISVKEEEEEEENKRAKRWKSFKGFCMFEKSISEMKLNDLMAATNDFHKENIIGTGKTGTLYKASLPDGTFLTVKRLQDLQHSETQFVAEMATLGSVRHPNVVRLMGFCVAERERLLLYKHMPKGTLHDALHPQEGNVKAMEWPVRLKIGVGAAKGLAWVHHNCNPRILHRNISSKCILLDDDYEPKISDFGFARLMNPIDTHLSTFVNGEFGDFGYVAPEYAYNPVATPEGDVYSFGVVLLELVTGERPTHASNAPESFEGGLVEWINYLANASLLQNAVDVSLIGQGYDSELRQVMKVGCACVFSAPKQRPSMFEVYQLLLSANGERNHYNPMMADDDIMLQPETTNSYYMDELIVAR